MFIFCIVFLVYVSIALVTQEIEYRQLLQEEMQYSAEIEQLHEEIERLEARLENSKDPRAIEQIAREKLKMVKPNEIIYIIQKDDE